MNNRSRNKDKAIKRYCSKIKMGTAILYVPYDPIWQRIQFNDKTGGTWTITPLKWNYGSEITNE